MPSRLREDALSEVIGFILILALIAALASLYLTYVVPAQGREGEIKHMATINDQFLGYKTAIDSLWINDQTNVPISRTFTLGTLTGTTQGSFVIPIFQPYPSSGSMVVNGRGETVAFLVDALIQAYPGNRTPTLFPIWDEPQHLYVKVRTSDSTQSGGVLITPISGGGTWSFMVNASDGASSSSISAVITPLPTFTYTSSNPPTQLDQIRDYVNNIIVKWSQNVSISKNTTRDLTLTSIKHQNKTFNNLIIEKNLENNRDYYIDLLDPAYGLAPDVEYPLNITLTPFGPWTYQYPVEVGYSQRIISFSHPMGSLEFLSNNKYWIQQNYYYQQGGVFLTQPNDGIVAKVLPLISITNETGIPTVRIVDITVKGSGNIGGTSPVQVISRLDSVSQNIFNGYSLARGIPNAKNVTITLNLQDTATAQMWNQTFARIKSTAGGHNWIFNAQNGNLATLTIDPIPSSPEYDIILDYSQVNISVELQPVAI